MHPDTKKYNAAQAPIDQEICDLLAQEIDRHLSDADNRIWHAHPVWFLDGNPIVGYSKLKSCVRFSTEDLARWLAKARDVQWDYRNLVRRKGQLERLK